MIKKNEDSLDLSSLPLDLHRINMALIDPNSPLRKEKENHEFNLMLQAVEQYLVSNMLAQQVRQQDDMERKSIQQREIEKHRRDEEFRIQLVETHKKDIEKIQNQLSRIAEMSRNDLDRMEKNLQTQLADSLHKLENLRKQVTGIDAKKERNTKDWQSTFSEYSQKVKEVEFKKDGHGAIDPKVAQGTLTSILTKTPSPVKMADIVTRSYAQAEKEASAANAKQDSAGKSNMPLPPPPPVVLMPTEMANRCNVNLELNFASQCLANGESAKAILDAIKENKAALGKVFKPSDDFKKSQEKIFTDAMDLVRQHATCVMQFDLAKDKHQHQKQLLDVVQQQKAELKPGKHP